MIRPHQFIQYHNQRNRIKACIESCKQDLTYKGSIYSKMFYWRRLIYDI